MVPAVRPLGSLSMARGCARIDSRPDTAKIGSAGRLRLIVPGCLLLLGYKNVSTRPGSKADLRQCLFPGQQQTFHSNGSVKSSP